MKKISFSCQEASTAMFVAIIQKLSTVATKGRDCKIRIGGDKFDFMSNVDTISDLKIDDRDFSTLTTNELIDFQSVRQALMSPVPPVPHIVNTVTPSDNDTDNDDDDVTSAPPPPSTSLSTDDIGDIKGIVNSIMARNGMFTAFDITKEMRQSGKMVKHYEVKDIVHGMYTNGEMGTYIRGLASFGNPPPFVYHPDNEDVTTYR